MNNVECTVSKQAGLSWRCFVHVGIQIVTRDTESNSKPKGCAFRCDKPVTQVTGLSPSIRHSYLFNASFFKIALVGSSPWTVHNPLSISSTHKTSGRDAVLFTHNPALLCRHKESKFHRESKVWLRCAVGVKGPGIHEKIKMRSKALLTPCCDMRTNCPEQNLMSGYRLRMQISIPKCVQRRDGVGRFHPPTLVPFTVISCFVKSTTIPDPTSTDW